MTYMKLLKNENGFITYEYGKDKENIIGTVTVEISNKENVDFYYYPESDIQKFCKHTANTIGRIYNFINNNNFPDEYNYCYC